MNPYVRLLARRNWQALAAVLVFLVSAGVHEAGVRPLLARYQKDVQRAVALGMPLEGAGAPPTASSRVTALISSNSLAAAEAEEQGSSGGLTSALLDRLTRLSAKSGLEVVGTEQGLVTQLPTTVLVRAHLKLRGSFAEFVDLLDTLSRSGALISVDRFTLHARQDEGEDIEVWMSQLVLKRTRGAS
jgi:hypothetical protein